MTGKIFKESSNVYEDEAKILFDYYKKAAEKIVEEEIALENKIEEAVNNKNSSQERQKKHKVISIATGSVSLAALIGGIVTFFLQLFSVAVIHNQEMLLIILVIFPIYILIHQYLLTLV